MDIPDETNDDTDEESKHHTIKELKDTATFKYVGTKDWVQEREAYSVEEISCVKKGVTKTVRALESMYFCDDNVTTAYCAFVCAVEGKNLYRRRLYQVYQKGDTIYHNHADMSRVSRVIDDQPSELMKLEMNSLKDDWLSGKLRVKELTRQKPADWSYLLPEETNDSDTKRTSRAPKRFGSEVAEVTRNKKSKKAHPRNMKSREEPRPPSPPLDFIRESKPPPPAVWHLVSSNNHRIGPVYETEAVKFIEKYSELKILAWKVGMGGWLNARPLFGMPPLLPASVFDSPSPRSKPSSTRDIITTDTKRDTQHTSKYQAVPQGHTQVTDHRSVFTNPNLAHKTAFMNGVRMSEILMRRQNDWDNLCKMGDQ